MPEAPMGMYKKGCTILRPSQQNALLAAVSYRLQTAGDKLRFEYFYLIAVFGSCV